MEIFNVSTSVENNCIKTHTFETDINFVRTQKGMHDIFNMKLQPLSESVSILSFVYKPCEKASLIFLPTGITNLGGANETICLRNPVRGVMEINRILELSLISEPPLDNFLSGQITFHANLCLSRSWLSMAWITGFDAKDFYFLICTNKKTNFGEDYLIWKSNFSTDLFLFSRNRISIYLPGKTFNTELTIDNNTLNGKKCIKCYIQYRWYTKGSTVVFDEKTYGGHIQSYSQYNARLPYPISFFNTKYKYFILSRNLQGDYDKPVPITWYEAQKMCQNKNTHLPSIVSYNDVEVLMKFVRTVSFSALVTNFFIGLHKKVCHIFCWIM